MNDSQFNYLNMANAAVAVLDKNNSIWGLNTKFSGNVTAIKGIITSIYATEGIQQTSAKGATATEHKEWQFAAEKANHVCLGIKTYYMDTDDLTNFGMVNYTMSDFIYAGRQDAIDRMKRVNEKAGSIPILDLADYNVSAQDITDSEAATQDFIDAVPGQRVIKSESIAATDELPRLFTLLRKKFVLQDLFVGTYMKSQPVFYDTYKASRSIINYGKTQQAEELHLMPMEFKAIFGNKFEIGNWFTVRNHSDFAVKVQLTDTPEESKMENEITVEGNSDLKLEVPKDFNNIFKHWLMILNTNSMDDVHVTVILSKGKSQSDAEELTGKITPEA